MSRVSFSKILYISLILILLTGLILVTQKIKMFDNTFSTFALCIILLIPGRIQRHFFKDFYTARKMLDNQSYSESFDLNNRFLQYIADKPQIKKLMIFSWGIYTKDIEAMTLNNMASALIFSGNMESAAEHLNRAIELDHKYPLPFYNYSILSIIDGNMIVGEEYFNKSKQLGYKKTSFDDLINKIQSITAAYQTENK